MEISNERYKAHSDAGRFFGSDTHAPETVVRALLTLVGSQEVVAATLSSQVADQETTWRALWLTDSTVAWVEAVGNKANWTGYNEYETAGQGGMPSEISVTSWARRIASLEAISAVELCNLPTRGYRPDTTMRWLASTRLEFGDGQSALLPLFGEPRNTDAESAEDVLGKIQARWR